jgi:hypothetical protein
MLSWSAELDLSSSASKDEECDRCERFALFTETARCGCGGRGWGSLRGTILYQRRWDWAARTSKPGVYCIVLPEWFKCVRTICLAGGICDMPTARNDGRERRRKLAEKAQLGYGRAEGGQR